MQRNCVKMAAAATAMTQRRNETNTHAFSAFSVIGTHHRDLLLFAISFQCGLVTLLPSLGVNRANGRPITCSI